MAGDTLGAFSGYVNAGSTDAFLRKYDANGNALWTLQFGTAGADSAHGVATDSSLIYVAGSTTGALFGQTAAGGSDAFVLKLRAQ